MENLNQVGDVIKGFSFQDYDATEVKDGRWTVGNQVDVAAKGEWLVVEARMTGGDHQAMYPNGWHITLQKLGKGREITDKKEVRYAKPGIRRQPAGRQVTVTQSGCFSNIIDYVKPVARLKKIVTVEWEEVK